MIDNLIYGKSGQERIVGVEIEDSNAILFKQTINGEIYTESIPNRSWILSHNKAGTAIRLKGNQWYKYGHQFNTIEEFNEAKKNLRPKDMYTVHNLVDNCLVNKGITFFRGMNPHEISILSFDIETTTLDHNKDARLLIIANTFRKNGNISRKLFAYDDYQDEGKMIEAWCSWVREMDPTILNNHNIYGFDLPYIKFIADKFEVPMLLGRDGSEIKFNTYDSKFRKDQGQDLIYRKCYVYGRQITDTFFLAIKHDVQAKKYESYGLKPIIKAEGLEKKDREFYDASQIRFKYKDPIEWKKIKAYALDDSDDSLKLFDLFIPPIFYLTQMVPKSFQEVICSASGSQINSILVRSYLQEGHSVAKASEINEFQGATVFCTPGIFKNSIRLDISSMYPSLIRQYKIHDKNKDPEANFLKLIDYLAIERLKNKKLSKETSDPYYEHLSNSQKITANSGYGFMSAHGLNYNSPENASLITRKGRETLNKGVYWATGKNIEELFPKEQDEAS